MAGVIANTTTDSTARISEMGGKYKLLSFYNVAVAAATDTLTLTEGENGGIGTITNVIATIGGGHDAEMQSVSATFSGLVITIKSYKGAGTAADTWSGTTANILVIGY